ncbi:hypothetical protein J2S30_001166 [Herbaspirillum rubrisubalbicans]|nr:hypothetical protein [Herbaspirillum rubrisubalbicans]
MPINYLRRLTSPARTDLSNRHLGRSLAFIAGAVNAGGFLAVGQYTSHMSGIVSSLADNLVLGETLLLVAGASALLSFLLGAACSAVMINWARRRGLHSEYAMPLMLEAMLLLCFGILGSNLENHRLLFVPVTVALLCFVMGLQNAMISKISRSEIRTTHVTGPGHRHRHRDRQDVLLVPGPVPAGRVLPERRSGTGRAAQVPAALFAAADVLPGRRDRSAGIQAGGFRGHHAAGRSLVPAGAGADDG